MISREINLRYEILERVGDGALFQVFKTRDKVIGRVTAVKVLLPELSANTDLCDSLRASAASVLELTHPNIARLYDVGEEGRVPYLVTEFARGIDLKERIRRIAPFTISVAVDFAIAIGEALQHAHAQGIVHGDLHPRNIIVTPEGVVKVTDFWVVSSLAQYPEVPDRPEIQPYRAPEDRPGGRKSWQSDVYALGAVLFEMLTGSVPGSALMQPGDVPNSARALNPGVPRSLDSIVQRALQPLPQDRYTCVADVLADLKSVRDALRFGKPLSWTPAGGEPGASITPPVPVGNGAAPAAPMPSTTDSKGPSSRLTNTSMTDDRVSPVLKLAIATMIVVMIVVGVVGITVWMAAFSRPPDQPFPNLVGMKAADARTAADKASVHLVEHEEYSDKYDAGIVYRSDWQAGRAIHPGRSINVWISRGSRMVWVPDVGRLDAQAAESKLKSSGLTLGQVDRQNNRKVPFGAVISQNPRAGKRVNRESQVNLQISDGPEPGSEPATDTSSSAGDSGKSSDNGANAAGGSSGEGDVADLEPRYRTLRISVKKDGRGQRRVRVEFDDARGTHTPIDEVHDEGEVASQRVEIFGRQIHIRVFYGDDSTPVSETTETLPEKR